MKLLPKQEAKSRIKKENEELIDTNIRLRKQYKSILKKLDTIKDDYTPERVKILEDFEKFCIDIQQKESKLLQNLEYIKQEIEKKKDIYFGMIERQDQLDERIYQADEKEKKLDLRENFLKELEKKQEELIST